jgi:hypothetical protein
MNLKPLDIYVALKLVAIGHRRWSYNGLAQELGLSPSEVHGAGKRLLKAGLAAEDATLNLRPIGKALLEFLVHGIRYVFVPERGAMTRGMPTGYAAPPLANSIVADGEPPPVWPDPEGPIRGLGFSPLHKSAPAAAREDETFYELLALTDALRAGRARERQLASELLKGRFEKSGAKGRP